MHIPSIYKAKSGSRDDKIHLEILGNKSSFYRPPPKKSNKNEEK